MKHTGPLTAAQYGGSGGSGRVTEAKQSINMAAMFIFEEVRKRWWPRSGEKREAMEDCRVWESPTPPRGAGKPTMGLRPRSRCT